MRFESWQKAKLGTLCTKIGSGATPRGGKEVSLDEGPFTLIRSQNVLDFVFSYEGLAYIDENQAKQLSNVELQKRDILLNITGDSVARVCQTPSMLLPARVNQHVAIIRPNASKLIPEYLKYFLLNPQFKNYMLGLASVGATRNALTKGMIEEFEIDLPPLPTQRRIADILSALDDKIELNRQTNATLEAIAQAIFKQWFVDFRFPLASTGSANGEVVESELGLIPKDWKVGELGYLGRIITGKTPSTKDGQYFGDDVPFITPSDMNGEKTIIQTNRYLTDKGVQAVKSAQIPAGAILVSCIGSQMGKVTYSTENSVTNQQINSIILKEDYYREYIYYNLINRQEELRNLASSGSAVPILNKNHFSGISIMLPPQILLQEFAKVALPIAENIMTNEREALVLAQLRTCSCLN